MKPTLVVMAAGMGSRYGGIKQIDPVGMHGETLLDYSTFDAFRNGFGKVVYIIRPDIEKDFRERLFDRVAKNCDAEYVFQTHDSLLTDKQKEDSAMRTKPWGTVHCVLCAREAVKTPFAVINADDYYGTHAFRIQGDYLSKVDASSGEFDMVGYLLKNTMSPAGSVSRGVCRVTESGMLEGMTENTRIEYLPDGRIVSHMPDGDHILSGEEWVSMNLFGFTPAVFDGLELYWEEFIANNSKEAKAECLLPNCVGKMVNDKRCNLRVFSSPDKWFGMTYKEDRETVRHNIAEKTAEGIYPELLWEKQ